MKEHILILELASQGALPDQIDEGSDIPVLIVRELVQAGYLTAIDAASFDGIAYLNLNITIPGRDYPFDSSQGLMLPRPSNGTCCK